MTLECCLADRRFDHLRKMEKCDDTAQCRDYAGTPTWLETLIFIKTPPQFLSPKHTQISIIHKYKHTHTHKHQARWQTAAFSPALIYYWVITSRGLTPILHSWLLILTSASTWEWAGAVCQHSQLMNEKEKTLGRTCCSRDQVTWRLSLVCVCFD